MIDPLEILKLDFRCDVMVTAEYKHKVGAEKNNFFRWYYYIGFYTFHGNCGMVDICYSLISNFILRI